MFPHFNWYAAGKNETAGRKSSDLENVEIMLNFFFTDYCRNFSPLRITTPL